MDVERTDLRYRQCMNNVKLDMDSQVTMFGSRYEKKNFYKNVFEASYLGHMLFEETGNTYEVPDIDVDNFGRINVSMIKLENNKEKNLISSLESLYGGCEDSIYVDEDEYNGFEF